MDQLPRNFAELSVALVVHATKLGITAGVRCSRHPRSVSRYIRLDGNTVLRISDHESPDARYDYNCVIKRPEQLEPELSAAKAWMESIYGRPKDVRQQEDATAS